MKLIKDEKPDNAEVFAGGLMCGMAIVGAITGVALALSIYIIPFFAGYGIWSLLKGVL